MKKLLLLFAAIVAIAMSASAQNRTYHGTVVDADGEEALAGASITPIGGGQGVIADADGKFVLTVPASVKQVKVEFIGYTPQTVALSEGMVVKLSSSSQMLDQVVVTGYGSGKKLGSLVGAVNVVSDKVLENTPSSNFVDALQGQVPGLTIFSNSGEPSAVPSSIRIRGVNSLNASTTPLFILDGAPTTSAVFTTLSPSDIESVTTLKDAASTAIYGSRAANGVIVITTKKGKYGEKGRVTVRADIGWSALADDNIELMNSQQYIEFRDKIHMPVSQEVRDLVAKYNINTDWMKELVKDNALTYSLEGRVQGGSEKVRYYLSLGHYDQDGLIAQSGIRRESFRSNIDARVNDWFQAGLSTNLGYQDYETNANATGRYTTNAFASAYSLLPYDTPRYYSFNDKGDIVYGDEAVYYHYGQTYNPNWLTNVLSNGKRTSVNATITLYEQLTPLKGLTLRAQQNVNAYDYRNESVRTVPKKFTTPMGDVVDLTNYANRTSESFQRWYQFTYTNTAEYRFNLKNNEFVFLLGQESIISKNDQFNVATTGQPDADQWMLTNGTEVIMDDIGQSIYQTVINSYFFNASYNYDQRYFLDFNLRRDGSSKFSKDHRWATFYAVGGMWNLKNESFLKETNWLSDLKLRVNYGTTGNSGIGNYAYQGLAGTGRPYNGQTSFALGSMSNPELTWETVKAFDAGFDFGVFDSRLRLTADFYTKKTVDMLMDVPFSFTTGFSSGTANVGSMKNVGVDVELNADIVRSKDFYLGAMVNFNYNKNTITELFNGLESFTEPGTGVTYEINKNPYSLHNVLYAGVDPRDGQQMWYTKEGNLTKTYNEERDQVDLGKSFIAPWNGGFGFNGRWKDISFRADFNWSAKKYIFNATYWYTNTAGVCQSQNGSVDLLQVWTKPGDITDYPNLTDLYGNPQEVEPDSRFVENSSFLRLKNLTLAYNLPKPWMNALKMESVMFHFTARNLFTITKYSGIDPEYEANAVHYMYPNTRQFEFGVEVSF